MSSPKRRTAKRPFDMLRKGIAGGRPHLILMDLMMPVMDGIEATRVMMKEFPELKIVMLTSFLEDEKVSPPSRPARSATC